MKTRILLPVAALVWASTGFAESTPNSSPTVPFAEPVELESLLNQVEQQTDRSFLVAAGVPKHLMAGHFKLDQLDYPLLLSVLRNNDLAAVTVQGVTNIVPETSVRSYPVPTVGDGETEFADDEWVTKLVYLDNITAPHTIPILRPLMPQVAHLAAVSELNAVLIVDRFANVNRLEGLLEDLDRAAGAGQVARSD